MLKENPAFTVDAAGVGISVSALSITCWVGTMLYAEQNAQVVESADHLPDWLGCVYCALSNCLIADDWLRDVFQALFPVGQRVRLNAYFADMPDGLNRVSPFARSGNQPTASL